MIVPRKCRSESSDDVAKADSERSRLPLARRARGVGFDQGHDRCGRHRLGHRSEAQRGSISSTGGARLGFASIVPPDDFATMPVPRRHRVRRIRQSSYRSVRGRFAFVLVFVMDRWFVLSLVRVRVRSSFFAFAQNDSLEIGAGIAPCPLALRGIIPG